MVKNEVALKLIIILMVALAVSIIACSPANLFEQLNWKQIENPRGFSLKIPKNYQISISEAGVILVYNPQDKNNVAFFKTASINNQDSDPGAAAESIIESMKNKTIDATLGASKDTKYGTVYKLSTDSSKGIILISREKNNAIASGLLFKDKEGRSKMLKTVASFKFRPDLIDPTKVKGLVMMKKWTEPNEKAFSMNIPKDWDIKGGLVRPYIDAATNITLTKGNMGIYSSSLEVPMYTEPSQVLAFAGFTEGSHYNPGGAPEDMIVKSWHDASAYLRDIYGPGQGAYDIQVNERSDIAQNLPKNALTATITAAEGSYIKDGIKNKVIAVTQETGMSGSYLWAAGVIHYWAPAGKIKTVESILQNMQNSLKVDPSWAAEEARQVQIRSKIISTTSNEIREMVSSSFELRSQTMDKLSDDWSDAILGVTDVYDPDVGESYTVPNDSNYYWKKGYEIYGTDTAEPPYPDPAFKELLAED